MDFETVLTAVRSWPMEKRLRLIGEVWDELTGPPSAPPAESLEELLDQRIASLDREPNAVISWEVVEARALERFRK
ncbi:MAG: addiction module protein [Isosphaeraceae bacterium]|nr:addiction module protein [Isosphaeraceae bacterium]